ncbi:gliding motility-associated C-terminal domain-containing protein [Sinomicrobium weinanense]|uniref:Gliding motility-associated C-terminal domain-containing protein n=1 Tax=Sinomicrobium weinanense TaxID=2842200 RepID=A0A926JTP6_9FLAO|nr:gliding motility-associated C-terminal domain-containing protein [Sinomicrobium weinanense]MBC9797355.1 gliding motility-associated C-terminal domain-containing protein [Sinomicrobium weinanense]MBU3123414.1 gliding motility-associated C-terminal domain-containing protein [Sinomicrobium weinanense]
MMRIRKLFFIFLCFWQYAGAQGNDEIIVIPPGSTVNLHASSRGAFYYQWFRNGEAVNDATGDTYAVVLEGIYTVVSFNVDGCSSEISNEVEVRFSDDSSPPPDGESDQYFCMLYHPVIADIKVTGINITWYDAPREGHVLPGNHPLEEGVTYYASQSPEAGGNESGERLAVTVFPDVCPDLAVTKEVDDPRPLIDRPVNFTVRVANKTPIAIRDIVIVDRLPSGYAYISHWSDKGTYNASSGTWVIPVLPGDETGELQVRATVLFREDYVNVARLSTSDPRDTDETNNRAEAATSPRCLTVYNLFSPNEDGNNDTFRIDCIENYPENQLRVYNRYGNLVFKQKGYDNSWKGSSNIKNTISRNGMLPVGTYYYVLDLGDGSKPVSGWLYIMR